MLVGVGFDVAVSVIEEGVEDVSCAEDVGVPVVRVDVVGTAEDEDGGEGVGPSEVDVLVELDLLGWG